MDLLDPEWLEDTAQVLEHGAKKYEEEDWRKGLPWRLYIAAAYRHLNAIHKGEDDDPESGKSHAAHLGACAMILNWYLHHREEFDDRYVDTSAIKLP